MLSEPEGPVRRLGRPPNADGAQTRARLLDAALELFSKQGYAATSVRQIADVVGVRDSAIYAHFDGKQQIYDSLVNEHGPELLRRIDVDGAWLAQRPPAQALPEFVDNLVAVWDEPQVRMATSMLLREGLAGIQEALTEVQRELSVAFGIWSEQGMVRSDVELDLLVWELVSPLAATRLLMLHADASAAVRRRGRRLAHEHAAYFVGAVVPEGQHSSTSDPPT